MGWVARGGKKDEGRSLENGEVKIGASFFPNSLGSFHKMQNLEKLKIGHQLSDQFEFGGRFSYWNFHKKTIVLE
jgi:hypothetical protein